jgi:chemotaxis protein CheC
MQTLTEIQKDAVGEIFNMAIGQSASSLSMMLDEEIELSVPQVLFLPRDEAIKKLEGQDDAECCAVRQVFDGSLTGETWMVFPATKSLELVRSILDEFDDLEDMTDLEQEALGEVGNVVLNSCLASLANELGLKFQVSLPELFNGKARSVLVPEGGGGHNNSLTMLIDVRFAVKDRKIDGHILLVLGVDSVSDLISAVDGLMANFDA